MIKLAVIWVILVTLTSAGWAGVGYSLANENFASVFGFLGPATAGSYGIVGLGLRYTWKVLYGNKDLSEVK